MATDRYAAVRARLARNLRRFREQRGLTQEDMERFGIPYKYYQRLESTRSRSANITLRTLAKLARALQVAAYRLIR
ncbi:MAG: helix-turn-helix transcriptional regulator [Nitrospirae bacterium]|nr:helix-turn-helix transcriptional regulator [Nitrospirota bacterium]